MTASVPIRLSHVGLYVRDIEMMVAYYRDLMGFVETDRASRPKGDVALSREKAGLAGRLVPTRAEVES